jgi:hypothetical protein
MKKRALLVIPAIVLFACGALASRSKTEKLAYRTIQSGSGISIQSSQPRAFIAWNQADYKNFWSTLVGPTEPPKVDFKKERPILLHAGARPTGGWNIQVRSAHRDRDVVYVTAPVVGPSRDMIVTQAITHPYVLIAVPTKKARNVRWLDGSGRDIELSDMGGPAVQ